MTGNVIITEPGTVIDGVDLYGRVSVRAPNVVIKNSIIRGSGPHSTGLVMSESTNLVIQDTEIAADHHTPGVNGVTGSNFTLERVNIHHVIDPVHIFGEGNVTIKDSWFHNNLHYPNDPNWGGGPSHDDSVQIQSGSNITITGSRLEGAYNAAVQVTQDRGAVSNVRIENNTIAGGSCSINISEKGQGPIRGLNIANNVFERDQRINGCAIIHPSSSPIGVSGNAWSDGSEVRASRG